MKASLLLAAGAFIDLLAAGLLWAVGFHLLAVLLFAGAVAVGGVRVRAVAARPLTGVAGSGGRHGTGPGGVLPTPSRVRRPSGRRVWAPAGSQASRTGCLMTVFRRSGAVRWGSLR